MKTSINSTPWLMHHQQEPQTKLRLFCFPYAGGGASAFRLWPVGLPGEVEVCAVQLPGRENRIAEPLISDINELVPVVCDALSAYCDSPFIFFGHSVGSLLAFELCRELRCRGAPLPLRLIVSGGRAPHIPVPNPLHQLKEDAFVNELRKFSGTSEAVLHCQELMQIYIPILRADFALRETYCHSMVAPLDVPISAYGGTADKEVAVDALTAWSTYTCRDFSLEMIEGGHFFLHTNRDVLLRSVSGILKPYLQCSW